MTFLIHEMFDTDLDDIMACYQTGCSSFGLLACEQAPSEPARSEKNSASEERDSASEASGTRGSL